MLFICKLITTPILIGLSLLASRRWNTVIGAAIAGLPFISGPGSVFLFIDNGAAFASNAAHASLFGMIASCVYCVAYGHLAKKLSWKFALPLSLLIFALTACFFKQFGSHNLLWAPIAFAFPLICTRFVPKNVAGKPAPSPNWKILVQMLCGGGAVLVVTGIAALVGEFWSGVMLTFPIISSVLIPFAHQSHGFDAAIDTIKGLLIGLTGTAAFNIFLAFFLLRMPALPCYLAAFGLSMVLGVFFVLTRKPVTAPKLKRGSTT